MNLEEIEKYYTITKQGEIISKRTGKPLKPWICSSGYQTVMLYLDTKNIKVMLHRLVALKHIPNPDNLPIINHKDGNKLNNNYTNLEWCTYAYNNKHAAMFLHHDFGQIKVIQKDKQGNVLNTYDSIFEAAKANNINYSSLAYCVRGKYKTSGGYYWERATTIREE